MKPPEDGSTFDLKYLGSTLLDELEEGKSYGNSISAEAVNIIVHMVICLTKIDRPTEVIP